MPQKNTPRPGRDRAIRLRTLAGRVAKHPRRHAGDIAEIGELLLEAKGLLGHGRYRAWMAKCLPGSVIKAQLAMQLATRQQKLQLEKMILSSFGISAVPFLVRAPLAMLTPKLFEDVCQSVRPISAATCKMLAAGNANRPEADVELQRRRDMLSSAGRAAAARNWLRLVALLSSADMFSFDMDHDEESPRCVLVVLRRDGRQERFCRRSPVAAILAAAGEERERVCGKCRLPKPPDDFPARGAKCRLCERERTTAAARVRRAGEKEEDAALQS